MNETNPRLDIRLDIYSGTEVRHGAYGKPPQLHLRHRKSGRGRL